MAPYPSKNPLPSIARRIDPCGHTVAVDLRKTRTEDQKMTEPTPNPAPHDFERVYRLFLAEGEVTEIRALGLSGSELPHGLRTVSLQRCRRGFEEAVTIPFRRIGNEILFDICGLEKAQAVTSTTRPLAKYHSWLESGPEPGVGRLSPCLSEARGGLPQDQGVVLRKKSQPIARGSPARVMDR
jgi:hypothetical protein